MSTIQHIPTNQITPGDNDRQHFDPLKLEELAASIAAHSLAQPITVRPIGPQRYEIVAGERRFRAVAQVLGRDTVPAIVRELDDEAASAIMLAENTGRADLNPIEEARAYQARVERFDWPPEHIADVAGVSADLVKRRLSLLDLIPEAQQMVAFGHLPIGHAEAMTRLDSYRQLMALRVLRESDNVPLRTFRHVVGQLLQEQSQDALFDLAEFWVQQTQEPDQPLPRMGKRAMTGAPTRDDLPPVPPAENLRTDTTGALIDRYIAALLEAGYEAEAAAVGNLYDALVRDNYTQVPLQALLLAR